MTGIFVTEDEKAVEQFRCVQQLEEVDRQTTFKPIVQMHTNKN